MRRIALAPSAHTNSAVVAGIGDFLDATNGNVLTYRAMPGEIDLAPLLDRSDRHRFHVTRTPEAGPLTVHSVDVPHERHRYGFDQPIDGAPMADPASISIVLVPAVAFGRDGSRLGHGAGYYDRLLPSVSSDACLVGVAWAAMLTDRLPTDIHDVAMTHLADETGVSAIVRSVGGVDGA